MTGVVHVVSGYRAGAVAVGGVTTAARAIAGIDPTHRWVSDVGTVTGTDVVHLHHALAFEGLGPIGSVRHLIKTVHVLQRRQSRMRGAIEVTRSERAQVAVLARADRVTVATETAKAMLLEDYGEVTGLAAKVTVIPLVPPIKRARGPRGIRPKVVAVTRFDKLKGTELLVEVVARLLEDDVEVVIAGGLPDHPKYERRWLEAFRRAIPEHALGRFSFVGWLGGDAVAELLAAADVMLAPSRLETCGLAVWEAMAAGCPVVASGISAHREVAGEAALYADGLEMAEATRSVLGSPALALRMSALGQDRVPDREVVTNQWLHFWGQTR